MGVVALDASEVDVDDDDSRTTKRLEQGSGLSGGHGQRLPAPGGKKWLHASVFNERTTTQDQADLACRPSASPVRNTFLRPSSAADSIVSAPTVNAWLIRCSTSSGVRGTKTQLTNTGHLTLEESGAVVHAQGAVDLMQELLVGVPWNLKVACVLGGAGETVTPCRDLLADRLRPRFHVIHVDGVHHDA